MNPLMSLNMMCHCESFATFVTFEELFPVSSHVNCYMCLLHKSFLAHLTLIWLHMQMLCIHVITEMPSIIESLGTEVTVECAG